MFTFLRHYINNFLIHYQKQNKCPPPTKFAGGEWLSGGTVVWDLWLSNKTFSSNIALRLIFADIPQDETFERQTQVSVDKAHLKAMLKKRRERGKKREIRVFVSSTFRDFGKEREEIIKKAFREVRSLWAGFCPFFISYIML